MKKLDELHKKILTLMKAHPEGIFRSKDISGEYQYLEFEHLEVFLNIRIGKYLKSDWTFIDMPFRQRVMMKHFVYEIFGNTPSDRDKNQIEHVLDSIEANELTPVINAA